MAYKILSLDGGGTWAMLEAMALRDLYGSATRGHEVLGKFDLVAANSGGAFILGALRENWTLQETFDFFFTEATRKRVFASRGFSFVWPFEKLLGIGYRYDTAKKFTALQGMFPVEGTKPMSTRGGSFGGSARHTDLLIVGFNYDTVRAAYFRSNSASLASSGGGGANPTLNEAIHISSTAPVNYFDAPAAVSGCRYWDGAVAGINNPALAGVIEALRNKKAADTIHVLSLGSGAMRLPLASNASGTDATLVQDLPDYSVKRDIKKIAHAILDDPPDAATFVAHVSMGGVDATPRIIRMNPILRPVRDAVGKWQAPPGLTLSEFRKLRDLDFDVLKQKDAIFIETFGKAWLADAVPNQPIQMDGGTFAQTIPYESYSQAKAAWIALPP